MTALFFAFVLKKQSSFFWLQIIVHYNIRCLAHILSQCQNVQAVYEVLAKILMSDEISLRQQRRCKMFILYSSAILKIVEGRTTYVCRAYHDRCPTGMSNYDLGTKSFYQFDYTFLIYIQFNAYECVNASSRKIPEFVQC